MYHTPPVPPVNAACLPHFLSGHSAAPRVAFHSLRGMRIVHRVEQQSGGPVTNVESGPAMSTAGESNDPSARGTQAGNQGNKGGTKTRGSRDGSQRVTRSHSRREAEQNSQPATPSAALGAVDAPKGGEPSKEDSKGRGRGAARGGGRGRARGLPRGTARGGGGDGRGGGRGVGARKTGNNVADEGEGTTADDKAARAVPIKRKVNDERSPNPEKAKKTRKAAGVPAPALPPFRTPTTSAWANPAREGGADTPVPAFQPVLPSLPPYPPIMPPSETLGYAAPQLRGSSEPSQFSFGEYEAPEGHAPVVPVVDPMLQYLDQRQVRSNEPSMRTSVPKTLVIPSQRPPVHPAVASANRMAAAQFRGTTPSTASAGRRSVTPGNGAVGAPVHPAVLSANCATNQSRGTTPSTASVGRGFVPPVNSTVGSATGSGQRSRAQSQAPDAGGSEWSIPNRPKVLSSGPGASMRPPAEPAMKSDGIPKAFSIKVNQAQGDICALKDETAELTKKLKAEEQRVAVLEQDNIALRKSYGELKAELGEVKELAAATSEALMALDLAIKGAEGLSQVDKTAAAQATKPARDNRWNNIQPAMEDGFFAVDEENPQADSVFLRPDFGQSWKANAGWHEWAVTMIIQGNVVFNPYLRPELLEEKGREVILNRLKDLFKSAKSEWKRQGMDAGLKKTKLSTFRRKARKAGKSVDRSVHRTDAGLEHEEWDFLFMPGYQSTDASSDGFDDAVDPNTDEENDGPGLVKPWISHAPAHRSALVQGKIDELSDLASIRIRHEIKEGRKSTHRRKRGEMVERPIPVLAKGTVKIPGWAVDVGWLDEVQDSVNWSLLDMAAPVPQGYGNAAAEDATPEGAEDATPEGAEDAMPGDSSETLMSEDGFNYAMTSAPEERADQGEDGYGYNAVSRYEKLENPGPSDSRVCIKTHSRTTADGQYYPGDAGEETWGAPATGLTEDEEEDLYASDG
ncbi:hypothetical protein FA95DRAFT_1578018 [Auriscalpium vulgare]|uniref:Uncharacterized protein n=1 Tax=Auriscalpium vulgare TaxID=40419 RepID=A0ACB8R3X7_9AGAM|nr:hypothetical protein FA95DRAFT_1578018 [Auriscalpium vulgare]